MPPQKKRVCRGLSALLVLVPAALAAVAAVGLQYDVGILALVADRAVVFHPFGLGLFIHGD